MVVIFFPPLPRNHVKTTLDDENHGPCSPPQLSGVFFALWFWRLRKYSKLIRTDRPKRNLTRNMGGWNTLGSSPVKTKFGCKRSFLTDVFEFRRYCTCHQKETWKAWSLKLHMVQYHLAPLPEIMNTHEGFRPIPSTIEDVESRKGERVD